MHLMYRRFYNPAQDRYCFIPAGRYGNFKLAVRKLLCYARCNWKKTYIAHVTLTVSENVQTVETEHINRVMAFIRKRFAMKKAEVKYLWVKEHQKRGAVHFHLMILYSRSYACPGSAEIACSWKLGFVKVTAPKMRMKLNSLVNYLGKYIGKGYEFEEMQHDKKSHSSSQIPALYRKSANVVASIIGLFQGVAIGIKGYRIFADYDGENRHVFSLFGGGEWYYVDLVPEPF